MKKLFSKFIVVYCIAFCSYISIRSLNILESTGISASDVLIPVLGMFGGELLILCLKHVLDKRADSKCEETKYEEIKEEINDL